MKLSSVKDGIFEILNSLIQLHNNKKNLNAHITGKGH